MAKSILVANWKNYPNSVEEAKDLLKELSRNATLYKKLSLFIAPPFPYLDLVGTKGKSFSKLASQDLSSTLGTVTGEVSPAILKSFGVRLSIIGHSERRTQGESNQDVSKKIKVALKNGIMPIVCIGERARDNEGEYFEFLREEIKTSLHGLSGKAASSLILAYEPVWAVGKNATEVITPPELAQSIIFIRKVLTDLFGRKVAEAVPILYGGSVDPRNAEGLASGSGIRGFLIGRASLNAKNFAAIAEALI